MRKLFFMVTTTAAITLAGVFLSVKGAGRTETVHIYLQTVLWVSKEAGPKPTVQKFGEVYGFSPSTVTVTEGDRLDLTIRNLQAGGDDTHTFTLPAFGINKDIPPLGIAHVSFLANKAGVFAFHCNFHKPWMSGELVVLPRR